MLNWAITFLVIALIAGVLGLSGVAGAATQIACRELSFQRPWATKSGKSFV